MLLSHSISPAVTIPGPLTDRSTVVESVPSIVTATPFKLRSISITSSRTPSIVLYSCSTPSISTLTTAHPVIDDRRILRNALPSV